ncbi:type II secretion system protein [Pseudothermotoga sp. U03pept]|uniref:type II secretion system protein n=1 Tax=Pseudothermotoga sp. U03pept TaxID=3447012 RepID=UPI003F04EC76
MRKGFTLIELLIVLAVIAALMAIVTPIALNAVAQAKATQVASNFRNIKSAVESYVNIERNLPDSTNTLVTSGYLNSVPSGFGLESGTFTDDEATVTISFTGAVDATKVKQVYSEITGNSGNLKLELKFRKWW